MGENFHFGGYATKYNVKCSDGRVIADKAFSHCDGLWVPIVWQHRHDSPADCIGKGLLEDRDDGLYIKGIFNNTFKGMEARKCVMHGDVDSLSIFANHVDETDKFVAHGDVKEVSLVYSGANKEARIDTLSFSHEDGSYSGEAIIYSGDEIDVYDSSFEHSNKSKESDEKMENKDDKKTADDVIKTMNEEQKNVMYYAVQKAYEEGKKDANKNDDGKTVEHSDGDDGMVMNAFETNGFNSDSEGTTFAHADFIAAEEEAIFKDAKRCGSFKDSFIAHSADYGIDNIEVLFPDAKLVADPSTVDRDQTWVGAFMNKATKKPFSKIKSSYFDITEDEARARGYVKGEKKVAEVIQAFHRETEPCTVYKMQAFDRDDILDMDFDAVGYIIPEMKGKLTEEIARAALITDGRGDATPKQGKVPENHIRPIWTDNDAYSVKVPIPVTSTMTSKDKAELFIENVIRSRKKYRGSGNPDCYMSEDMLSDILLLKDGVGHFMYKSVSELATVLRVGNILTMPQMEGLSRKGRGGTTGENANDDYDLAAIIVNPKDYSFGAVKGGELASFNDFDIDFNQYKYLIESRLSGALTVPYSALVIEFKKAAQQQVGG